MKRPELTEPNRSLSEPTRNPLRINQIHPILESSWQVPGGILVDFNWFLVFSDWFWSFHILQNAMNKVNISQTILISFSGIHQELTRKKIRTHQESSRFWWFLIGSYLVLIGSWSVLIGSGRITFYKTQFFIMLKNVIGFSFCLNNCRPYHTPAISS